MIYFENYRKSRPGLNNHVISYVLCVSLSNFLDRDFFFDFELPCSTPPDFAVNSDLKKKFEIVMNSPRSLVSELLTIPNRRVFEIDREVQNKIAYENLFLHFMTDEQQKAAFQNTWMWNYFSLGRGALVKEELQNFDLIEIGDNNLINVSFFYFLNKAEKNALLDSVKITYTNDLEALASKIIKQQGAFHSVQLRLGDFLQSFKSDGFSVNLERFKNYIDANFENKDLPVLIATDGLQEKELFAGLFENFEYKFIDELIFDEYSREYGELKFTDFNALSILNQLICAASENFIGTCRSTFTSVIHRLRQERCGKTDFDFFPDDRISRLLTPDYKIKPDNQGFFEWNKYSIFAEHYQYPAWMREWNYEMTSI